jgi:hypothetical protein
MLDLARSTTAYQSLSYVITRHFPSIVSMANFKEGLTQRLELPEDSVEILEVLLELMQRHSVSDILWVKENGEEAAQRCIDFLEYAEKQRSGGVSVFVFDALRHALKKSGKEWFSADWIEIVFNATSAPNPLRNNIVQALPFEGVKGSKAKFRKQEEEVEGFAAEILQQIRKCMATIVWHGPLFTARRGLRRPGEMHPHKKDEDG